MNGRPRFASLVFAPLLLSGCYLGHRVGPEGEPPPEPPSRRDAGTRSGGGIVDSGFRARPDSGRRWDAAFPEPDAGPPPPPVECRDLGPRPGPEDRVGLLAWQREAILGAWEGTRGSPWDGTRLVEMRFDGDGTYFARCADRAGRDCLPMYWGDAVVDGPDARYELTDVTASGGGEGLIFPVWMGSSSWPGSIDSLVIGESGATLEMRMWDPEGRGPLTFSLSRACE